MIIYSHPMADIVYKSSVARQCVLANVTVHIHVAHLGLSVDSASRSPWQGLQTEGIFLILLHVQCHVFVRNYVYANSKHED